MLGAIMIRSAGHGVMEWMQCPRGAEVWGQQGPASIQKGRGKRMIQRLLFAALMQDDTGGFLAGSSYDAFQDHGQRQTGLRLDAQGGGNDTPLDFSAADLRR